MTELLQDKMQHFQLKFLMENLEKELQMIQIGNLLMKNKQNKQKKLNKKLNKNCNSNLTKKVNIIIFFIKNMFFLKKILYNNFLKIQWPLG